ncbi:MAG: pyridoxamine 5'-phosphate oxidase family protein [Pseudomonadales bacterium]|jgi:nitroimidazol reductase NimA-like FMN-containing flavoprotein (pyridoxamine 5'-phosphate oxidase superfamily)|nr:pyridoxamine 5'-phosphate oxidase family protein [Pseudomonadales bacterium]
MAERALFEGVRLNGPWSAAAVASFLEAEHSPLRLAVTWGDGAPLVVSVWFRFEESCLWCASHDTSRLIRALRAAPRVGFEVSVNDPPYRGVRGQAHAELLPAEGGARLGQLVDRYLHGRDSRLARWLLSRSEDEVAIRLRPDWITSWDYSRRMGPPADD